MTLSEKTRAVIERNRDGINARFFMLAGKTSMIDRQKFSLKYAGFLQSLLQHGDVSDSVQDELATSLFTGLLKLHLTRNLSGATAITGSVINAYQEAALENSKQFFDALQSILLRLQALKVDPGQWLERLLTLAEAGTSLAAFKQNGLIAVWLCGQPQYRDAALRYLSARADKLSDEAFSGLMQIAPEASVNLDREEFIEKIRHNRLLPVMNLLQNKKPTALTVKPAGQFSGFGGLFQQPPVLTRAGENIYASDKSSRFQVFVDSYGISFVGASKADNHNHSNNLKDDSSDFELRAGGDIIDKKYGLNIFAPQLSKPVSTLFIEDGVLISNIASHNIFLVHRV